MLSEEQYNKVKKDLKKGIKQYIIAKKRKVSPREVGKIKRTTDFAGYSGGSKWHYLPAYPGFVDNISVPKQEEIPFYSTEDIYKLLLEIKDLLLKQNARQTT